MPKQALSSQSVEVGFDFELDDIVAIDFVFAQSLMPAAPILMERTWRRDDPEHSDVTRVPGENVLLIPFSEADTFLFKRGQQCYMDMHVIPEEAIDMPEMPIVPLVMEPSLFKQSEAPR